MFRRQATRKPCVTGKNKLSWGLFKNTFNMTGGNMFIRINNPANLVWLTGVYKTSGEGTGWPPKNIFC
jgi:hypothetical protein